MLVLSFFLNVKKKIGTLSSNHKLGVTNFFSSFLSFLQFTGCLLFSHQTSGTTICNQLTVIEARNWRGFHPIVKGAIPTSTPLPAFPMLICVTSVHLSDSQRDAAISPSPLSHFPLIQLIFSQMSFHLAKHKAFPFIQPQSSLIQQENCGEPQTTQHIMEINMKPLNFVRRITHCRAEKINHQTQVSIHLPTFQTRSGPTLNTRL